MLPNFLGIGAQRCGTTWLHKCLAEHPQVGTASIKEAHFFDNEWDRGIAWYESFFEGCVGALAVGEVTPEYISDPLAVERMASVIPNAKLIAIVRNPIDRAYSAYWLRRKEFQGLSFEEAIEKEPDLLDRGLYADQIRRVLKHYSRDQLLVLLFDDLERDDKAFMRRVFEFLGVDSEYRPSPLGRTHNAVLFPYAQDILHRLRLYGIIRFVKRTGLHLLIRRWHRASGKRRYPPMKEATRKHLQQYFDEPNGQLEELLGVVLHWA